MLISVVIPALNEGDSLRRTVEQLQATLPAESEIIVVDNGSSDGSSHFMRKHGDIRLRLIRKPPLGAAQARNHGAMLAKGEFLVFADGHVDVSMGWWQPLVKALEDPSVGAVGPVISVMGNPNSKGYGLRIVGPDLGCEWLGEPHASPGQAPALGGCLLAMRRECFEQVGGFDDGMIVWGSEDMELSVRLWLLGYQQLVISEVDVAHKFRTQHPYQVDWAAVVHNQLRLAFAHFNPARLERVIDVLSNTLSLPRHQRFWPTAISGSGAKTWSPGGATTTIGFLIASKWCVERNSISIRPPV